MSCKWKQESVLPQSCKVDIHCAFKSHWDFPIPCKNTDHISLWISVQIYPHLSLKLRQTKNLRFRSSPEIGLKSHGNLALKWLKTWELRRKIDEVEGSQSKVRVRLKRPPSATYMSLMMMKTHSIVTELPFVFILLFIAIHLQFCNVGPPNQFLQRTICDSQFWSSALIQ